MKTSRKPGYEPFPEISGSRSRLIISAARILLRADHPRTQTISISSQPSSKIRNEEAKRRAKREKSRKEGEDALATVDDMIRCTGKEQSAGGDTTSKDASSQTDPVLLPVDEGYIRKNQELSVK